MSKENVSATVDPEVAEYLEGTRNKSDTINEALRLHMNADGNEMAMLQLRENQLETRLRSVKNDVQEIEGELQRVRTRMDEIEQKQRTQRQNTLEEKARMLPMGSMRSTGPYVDLSEDALREHAQEVGVELETLRDKAIELYKEENDG